MLSGKPRLAGKVLNVSVVSHESVIDHRQTAPGMYWLPACATHATPLASKTVQEQDVLKGS
jgi:hypothetical protein